ncbi:winged helix DNA-binding domain-containing protein [Georgenia faecalis]|uniref:winged helix DNA-binding domain-containing protein n=1 Tax=Georgenia faecalis TaxID=2483799 RepID=UPI000FD7B077|nr:winged helix DNA-binding domain-containing protein [Georgenia faecalis]
MTTPQEVALLRLAAQRLVGPGAPTAADAAGGALATQAQDLPGALTSLALRTAGGTREDVVAALDAGEVVRSWPMRGTLHLLRGEDLAWMLALTTDRLIAGAATRRRQLGIDDADLARARDVALGALTGGGALTRRELQAVWEENGVMTPGQRGYHLIWYLAQTGLLCFGPVTGNEQRLVLLDEWVPAPRRLEREEALGELALRYFRSHGPASVRDLAGWTKLVAADVRAGVGVARDRLERVEVAGVEMFLDPETPERLAAHRRQAQGVHLLPGFDEFLLGYQDRSAALPPEFADRLVPGGNGVFRPTVVAGGQVVGTWRRGGTKTRPVVEATAFTQFRPAVERAIPRLFAELP